MSVALFYPHFYLSNDLFLRHQWLYTQHLLRVHSSDRSPRDSKEVIQFLEASQFVKSVIPTAYEEETARLFKTVLERAYRSEHPLYIQHLGKYGKERSSTKTFHFCRATLWPDLVELLRELGLAVVDASGEWCFSTRMMVMLLTACMTLENQKQRLLPRCTDLPEYDELAVLLECLPEGMEKDQKLLRAQLVFPYPIPKNLAEISPAAIQDLRAQVLPLTTENFNDFILDTADVLERAADIKELKNGLYQAGNECAEIHRRISMIIQEQGLESVWSYGRYHWYLNPESKWTAREWKEPLHAKRLAFHMVPVAVSAWKAEGIRDYPGSFLWAQEPPETAGGFLGKWMQWLKPKP